MKTFEDIINAQSIGSYWAKNGDVANESDSTLKLFPNKKDFSSSVTWLTGHKEIAQVVEPSTFDTASTLRDRAGFEKHEVQLGFFKESLMLSEKDKMLLRNFMLTDPNRANEIKERIFNDTLTLLNGAKMQVSRMRHDLLGLGKYSLTSKKINGAKLDADYTSTAWEGTNTRTLTAGDAWTIASKGTNDPIRDLLDAKNALEMQGVSPSLVYLNNNTYNNMMSSESFKKYLGADKLIFNLQKEELVKNFLGLEFVVVKGYFIDADGVKKPLFPDNKVTLVPNEILGNTVFGVTPAENEIPTVPKDQIKDFANVQKFYTVTTTRDVELYNIKTTVSFLVAPTLSSINNLYIITTA